MSHDVMKTCTKPRCNRKHLARGLCSLHYDRFKHSEDFKPKVKPTTEELFYAKTFVSEQWYQGTPCIETTGAHTKSGYGQISIGNRKNEYSHRWAYKRWIGPIEPLPNGRARPLDHGCNNKGCCNPWHTKPVTHRQNVVECDSTSTAAINAIRTHCQRGHEFTEANTRWISTTKGGLKNSRICRTCASERERAAYIRYRDRKNGVKPRSG